MKKPPLKSFDDLTPDMLRALIDLLMNRPCLGRKDLAQRYGRCLKTIDNYKRDGTLPEPKWFYGPLWTPAQILQAETSPKLKQMRKGGSEQVKQVLQKQFQFS